MHMYKKMESYCLKCKKYTRNINPQVSSTSNGKLMILSKCAICNGNKSRFMNQPEAKGLLSKLGIKTPLSKIPILRRYFVLNIEQRIKMNEVINKFLLVGDKFMPKMHLK